MKYSTQLRQIAAWAITMTELELRLNDIDNSDLNKWGFGQVRV
jgi:hypothetical protein